MTNFCSNAAVAWFGCQSASYRFAPYAGQQEKWTTGPGSYVTTIDGAALYAPGQYPNRPYTILGAATADSEHGLARAVLQHHADAALVSNQGNVLAANLIKFNP